MVPSSSKVGGDRSRGSHRAVAPMPGGGRIRGKVKGRDDKKKGVGEDGVGERLPGSRV